MKFVLNILKAFLINFIFIGIIHATTSCPAISPNVAENSAPEQVEAILNDDKVFLGGPVTPFSPFVLHSLEKKYDETHAVTSNIGVSSKPDIIQSILSKNFPEKFLVSFGYTGWSSGQLEKEIQQGSWVIIPANEQIIFSTKSDKKIEEASKLAGFNLNLVSSNYGKA